jgi:ribonuclease P protein component
MRLAHARQFQAAFARRCSVSDDRLIVYAIHNELSHPRLGMTVSRRHGPAVVRNRWKRLVREAFRLSQHELPAGIDLVVLPRMAQGAELAAVRESLVQLAQRVARKIKRPR